jgi:hypothetical protein
MAVLRLSDADRSRRDKLVGMLGSSFDGERLNALGLLQRMADSYKVPIHELLLTEENSGLGSSFDRQRAERAEREARDANLRAQRAERAAREAQRAPSEPDPTPPDLPSDWRELFTGAQRLNHSACFLTGWEANFVGDLLARGTRWPSPKQAVVIACILEKAAAFGSRATSPDADWEDVE